MGKILSIVNQKGGVGKTTSCINLLACLGMMKKKCLLVDIDSQGNATSGLGINKKNVEISTYDLLVGDVRASEAIIHTEFENIDLIPSHINLAAAEIELSDLEERTMRLRRALIPVKDQYDFIFIDCPPSLGLVTLNALAVSDRVLVPIQCEYYALEGLSQLMVTVRQVKRLYNPSIDLEGVLLTMYDGRLNLTLQVEEEVKKYFPNKVYHTVIPRNVRLSESPSFGMPAVYFSRSSTGSKAYKALAKEFMEMQEQ